MGQYSRGLPHGEGTYMMCLLGREVNKCENPNVFNLDRIVYTGNWEFGELCGSGDLMIQTSRCPINEKPGLIVTIRYSGHFKKSERFGEGKQTIKFFEFAESMPESPTWDVSETMFNPPQIPMSCRVEISGEWKVWIYII